MLILAFDTSGAACSVAVWRDGAVLARRRDVMERGQAEALMPLIAAAMDEAGVGYAALDRIAVTVGPGSFTGVRVGLAAARGLSLALGVPAVGLLTSEVLAAAVPPQERKGATRILAAIDTKRGDLYVQQFTADGDSLAPPMALAPAALADWIGGHAVVVVGDGSAAAAQALGEKAVRSSADVLVDAALLATLGAKAIPVPGGPLPVYVNPPAITPARAKA
ncbi:MAG: tRNA (adenosine(37)-N6)-threonylcarbamoyltransferase complex dimerization subunit type 1 TsaB [Rhodospirillaceae bacterium]